MKTTILVGALLLVPAMLVAQNSTLHGARVAQGTIAPSAQQNVPGNQPSSQQPQQQQQQQQQHSQSAPLQSAPPTNSQIPSDGRTVRVWVNTATNVYHCPGTRYYGATKAGVYMTEADAQVKGARPAYGKPCK